MSHLLAMKNMISRFLSLFIVLALYSGISFAQTFNLSGRVIDANDTSSLIGVTVALIGTSDSNIINGTATDASGNFQISGIAKGDYRLKIDYLGYKSITRPVHVIAEDVSIGTIKLNAANKELKSVVVAGKQIRADQLGDTSQFHADAFKTNPDATAEDLVNKMPGVTSDNSGVKVNGESVQQVLVDGKPFFGTDPALALKNLPSEVIDKIQIFDKLSDQATFTGFDDGNTQKTMNIVTKRNKSEGQFGKVYAGAGTDDRYSAGGSFNSFSGDQRISLIELSNNVNQQNFSSQDILGTSGSGGGRGGGAFGGGFGGGGGGGGNNFLVGQQSGINTTHSVGLNYSDQWGAKIKISASYFFNYTDNVNTTQSVRNYTLPGNDIRLDSNLVSLYNESDNPETKNFNHRFNVRFEYTIDSFNSLIITPNLSLQENYSVTSQIDSSFSPLNTLLSNAANSSGINNTGYTFSNNLLYQHKLHKKGRTISLNIGTSLNDKTGDGKYNTFTGSRDTTAYPFNYLNQKYDLTNSSNTISANLTYTEPIGKKSQLMFNYNPSVTHSLSDKETDSNANTSELYNFDTTLSNKYTSTYTTQRGGASYRLGDKKMNLMIGANLQYAVLDGNQVFPSAMNIEKQFTNVLPIAFFNYRFKDGRNLRIQYRTNISAPSINQLQNVVDVSNPLLLSTGNRNLRQDYEQTFILRYGLTKSKTSHNFFVYGYANFINNYIGTSTITNTTSEKADSSLPYVVPMVRGAQLTQPVNLNYYANTKLFVTYSIPAGFIKSNFNVNGGVNYTHTPGLIDNVSEYSNNLIPSLGLVLSSNVSENLDFTLSYTGNYNFIKNSLQTTANNNYYNHTAAFKINWILFKSLVLNTNITHSYYSTLSSTAGNVDFYMWNAYIAYKMLKNKALEARLSAFDILNQNKSITRTVAANYVENDVTHVLQQYFMFQLTYTLRNFKGPMPETRQRPDDGMMHGGPGGPGGPGGMQHNHGDGGM